ncbi:MAG: hypothetical protein CM15mP105_2540 [Methanobacteriota archaeon]|nr:MAG: hypothetical protein CM15mP105_2540 [Euryarchaeota archaeon]
MIYIGQFCIDPNNSSSPECSDGNYSMEASQFVRISQEFEKPDVSYCPQLPVGLEKDWFPVFP